MLFLNILICKYITLPLKAKMYSDGIVPCDMMTADEILSSLRDFK